MSLLVVALDTRSLDEAAAWARLLDAEVDGFKVGLELLMGVGPAAVADIVAIGKPVFVDAKLHDIPNTVEGAARRLGELGARWVTVHATGGADMLRAAVAGLAETSSGPSGVLAVTVLTSLDEPGLARVGMEGPLRGQVLRLAAVAAEVGVEGVVCSVGEAAEVRSTHPGLVIATPGIRDGAFDRGDQARVATPESAVASGSDILVVGRPITRAPDPRAAAAALKARIGAVPAPSPADSRLWSGPPRRREHGTTTPTD